MTVRSKRYAVVRRETCVACGSCTFACPAKRAVAQNMGLAKAWYMGELRKGGK